MHKTARSILIMAVTLLLIFGISMLYSTSYTVWGESLLKRQLLWISAGGVMAALAAWLLDYRKLGHYAWWLLAGFVLVLGYLGTANLLYHANLLSRDVVAKLPLIGGLTKGSVRWLDLWKFSVQPSEFAKLAIIILLANYLPRHVRHTREFWRGFLKPMGATGIAVVLILLGGDLSSTAITGSVVFGVAFIGGTRLRYLVLVAIAGLITAGTAVMLSPERVSRITSYRDPEPIQDGDGYQLWHSQLALGSGHWTGLGFTNSRMKRYYLPESHTDFIVAIVGEELGYSGVLALIILYSAVMVSAFWIGGLASDREGTILCSGIGMLFGLQALVNISVVSGFCPTTGVAAPFISYGGSSMVASLLGIGLLLSVSRISEQEQQREAQANHQPMPQPQLRQRYPRPQ